MLKSLHNMTRTDTYVTRILIMLQINYKIISGSGKNNIR